ncbi:hypothetical protein QTO34_007907 [Cnephaeus nilssonii]|uniref:Uncharacterized protein n=1 Tax=Cnephaeus nilssonii TaxID=3371016 RepID=A0AA40LTP0_CNENI|nr:hypothetical protein QTO34_007907 [Eptesicus nilssonii]
MPTMFCTHPLVRETQATACGRDARQLRWEVLAVVDAARAGLAPRWLLSGHGACSLAQAPGLQPPPVASAGLDCHSSCHDAWADPGPFPDCRLSARARPPDRLPSSALTAEELKYADICNIGAMITPLHFLDVNLARGQNL